MANSPLVARPTDALQPSKSLPTSSGGTPSGGLPRSARGQRIAAEARPTMDLMEQMNEDEKNKYIKGAFACIRHTKLISPVFPQN